MTRFAVVSLVLTLALNSPGVGQDKKKETPFPIPEPGPEHKLLATSLVGTWEAKVKMFMDPSKPPVETSGTMKRKMIMNGRFLQELYEGPMFGQTFYGMGVIGYDQKKKQYTMVWVDSMTTSTAFFHGVYDEAKKAFTYTGEDYDPMGKKMKARDVLTLVSPDEHTLEMYRLPEGAEKEFKMMEIRMKRTKK